MKNTNKELINKLFCGLFKECCAFYGINSSFLLKYLTEVLSFPWLEVNIQAHFDWQNNSNAHKKKKSLENHTKQKCTA